MSEKLSGPVKWNRKKRITLAVLFVALLMPVLLIVISYSVIQPYEQYILRSAGDKQVKVGLVLGAGVAQNGKPYKELEARLDSAADAYDQGDVDTLILSGDNRFEHYDEPTAMYNYLINERNIPEDALQRDYAGRSTYESCERAAKVLQLKQVIVFSAHSHLPRSIYLCRHFEVEAYGVGNNTEANNSWRREILARVKALYNVILVGEPTVLGNPIPLQP